MIIAIDGPTASGKGTMARHLAQLKRLPYLDTGLLYRQVAYEAVQAGIDFTDLDQLAQIALDLDPSKQDENKLRARDISQKTPIVAAVPQVRQALLQVQRAFAAQEGGAVLDGRDIGTVIAPHADLKLYITADANVRADRRHKELIKRGEVVSYEAILQDILSRDARDENRAIAPAKQAEDAHLIDTTQLDIQQALAAVMAIVHRVQLPQC